MSKRVQRNTRATALYQLLVSNTPFSELRVILIRPEDAVLFLNELGALATLSQRQLRIGAYGFQRTDFRMYVPRILDGDVFMLGSDEVRNPHHASDRWNEPRSRIIVVSSDHAIHGHISLHDKCRLHSRSVTAADTIALAEVARDAIADDPSAAMRHQYTDAAGLVGVAPIISAAMRHQYTDAAGLVGVAPIIVTANPDGIAVPFRCTKHTSDGAPGECDDPMNGFEIGVECFMRESHPPKPRAVQVRAPMSTPSRMHIDARLPPDIYQEVRYLVQRGWSR